MIRGMNEQPPKLLHTGAMARRLGVRTDWLRQEAKAGHIPALAAGDRYLFDPEAVEAELLRRARENGEGVRHE